MRDPAFKKTDVRRAIEVVERQGLSVARIDFDGKDRFSVVVGEPVKASSETSNPWDAALNATNEKRST